MEKILVIEDDPTVRLGIVDLLTEEGFETIEAENGRIGIEIAKKHLPDLIISDILMPEVDGYGVFEDLQNEIKTSTIPFIFLSARTDVKDIRYGMNLGADDYITKPYKTNDLIAAVNTRLSRNRYIDKKFNQLHANIAKSMPHELRTPLVSVIGFSEVILDNFDELGDKEIIEMVSSIKNSGNRLLNIIQKFLLFSELEIKDANGSNVKEYSWVTNIPVKEAVYSIVKFYMKDSERSNDVIMELADGNIKLDYNYFKFIIEQLLDNAIKFSPQNTEIRIKTGNDGAYYNIEITDYGIGMTAEQIKNVGVLKQFDKDKYFHEGIGMSMGIIKKIVDMYSGSFKIESEKNSFTKITISLKLNKN